MIVSRAYNIILLACIFLFSNSTFSQENNRIDTLLDFKNGKILLKKNKKIFVSDVNDPNVSKLQWDDLGRYAEPYYIIEQSYTDSAYSSYDSTWHKIELDRKGLINKHTGDIFIPPTYNEIREFVDGKAIVRIKYKFGIIGTNGKLILPVQYNFILSLANGKYLMKEDSSAVFYSSQLKKLLTITGITSMRPVSGKCLYIIIKDSVAGFMDCDGVIKGNKEWKEIDKMEDNLAFIRGKKGYGLYSMGKQKQVIEPIYKFYEYNDEQNSVFMRIDDQWTVFDTAGVKKGNFTADNIMRFSKGIYFYRLNNLWGLVNSNGQIIKKPEWAEFEGLPGYNFFKARKPDGSWKKYNLKGEPLPLD